MKNIPWTKFVPLITLILCIGIFAVADAAFLGERNLTNLARQVSVNCILAFGMTIIILLGHIDLSLGSVLALGAVVGALLQDGGLRDAGPQGAIISMLAVFGVCGALGFFNGAMVSKLKMPSFVVSLGLLVIARGAALILSDGSRIGPLSDSFRSLGTGFIPPSISLALIVVGCVAAISSVILTRHSQALGKSLGILFISLIAFRVFYFYQGIPIPVVIMATVFVLLYVALHYSPYGRYVYAVGGNPEAARLCGLPVQKVLLSAFALMGVLVALSALIESGRIDAGDPNAGNLYELDAIAAVVIGGTSLRGGVGGITGTLLGALLMGVVNNGMSLMNIPSNYQMVIKGLIIIGAVLLDVTSRRRTQR